MSREHLDAAALARIVAGDPKSLASEHLAKCAQCRGQAAELKTDLGELTRRVRASAPFTATSFVWPQAAPSRSLRPLGWLWSPAVGAAVLALILAVVWLGIKEDRSAVLSLRPEQTRIWAEVMDDEPERLGGFVGFLVAENSAGLEVDFISADDDEIATGAEGVILWPGVL